MGYYFNYFIIILVRGGITCPKAGAHQLTSAIEPLGDRPLTLHMDASETALGAMLSQNFLGEHSVLYVGQVRN